MFIHLGGDIVIRSRDVVAILDQNSHDSSTITREFLSAQEEDGVIPISEEQVKSVVVTMDNKVYLSPISSLTLKRRSQVVAEFDDYTEEAADDENIDS